MKKNRLFVPKKPIVDGLKTGDWPLGYLIPSSNPSCITQMIFQINWKGFIVQNLEKYILVDYSRASIVFTATASKEKVKLLPLMQVEGNKLDKSGSVLLWIGLPQSPDYFHVAVIWIRVQKVAFLEEPL